MPGRAHFQGHARPTAIRPASQCGQREVRWSASGRDGGQRPDYEDEEGLDEDQ